MSKYCTSCKEVYPDSEDKCLCKIDSWSKTKEFKNLPIEPECQSCESPTNLIYREPWKSGSYTFGNYCTCHKCDTELKQKIKRNESMVFLVITDDETELKQDKDEVEEFLLERFEDNESHELEGVLILKLEPVEKNITIEYFYPPYKTNFVINDGDFYRVEEVIKPIMEYDGSRSIIW